MVAGFVLALPSMVGPRARWASMQRGPRVALLALLLLLTAAPWSARAEDEDDEGEDDIQHITCGCRTLR